MTAIVSSSAPDVPFTPQQKAFIMSLFGIEAPRVNADEPTSPIPRPVTTSNIMQRKVQGIMDDIRALAPLQGYNWNYVEYSPFLEEYQKAPITDKINTLRFDRYDKTRNPDKHMQHFLALMIIHNASDVELCQLFPSSLRDSALS